MKRIIFLGVLHGDSRVYRALVKLKPDIISVEMSDERWNALRRHRLDKTHDEVNACLRYCDKYGKELFFIDKKPSKKEREKLLAESKDFSKLKFSRQKIKEIYSFFSKLYRKNSRIKDEYIFDDKSFGLRTEFMTKKLESIIKEGPSWKLVHVGGAAHFLYLKGRKTLYSNFRDKARRAVLIDVL